MSATQLVAAMHHHPDAGRIEVASLFKTGELDVDLLERAQLHVSEVLKRSPLVAVEIATYRTNLHSGRKEAVFGVRSDGVFIGHYAASAFRRLSA
ncbi:hypothetical protein [Acidovorax sp. sic0104]|uniref:hypothetical protein n=1 Tax=Acidovorax sp. sic0104 TaxID=2854784 RepID=UPI001C48A865|nr:hypothetical protein [Acidovorax sp. sic0104]MBV7542163.1 hypothetical protein [Acidovorax sp. sic0104]